MIILQDLIHKFKSENYYLEKTKQQLRKVLLSGFHLNDYTSSSFLEEFSNTTARGTVHCFERVLVVADRQKSFLNSAQIN